MPTELLSLPLELHKLILEKLPNHEVKKVRLTCMHLSQVGLPLLFSTVILSAFHCDIEKLAAISQRPVMAKAVTTIIYDVQEFTLEREELNDYNLEVQNQIRQDLRGNYRILSEEDKRTLVQLFGPHLDPRWNCTPNAASQQLYDPRIIARGKRAFETQRQHQADRSSDIWYDTVSGALNAFSNLAEIHLQTAWKSLRVTSFDLIRTSINGLPGDKYYHGRLPRHWSLIWLRPRTNYTSVNASLSAFFTLLYRIRRPIRHLDLGNTKSLFVKFVGNASDRGAAIPMNPFVADSLQSLSLEFDGRIALRYPAREGPDNEWDARHMIPPSLSLETLDIRYPSERIPGFSTRWDLHDDEFPHKFSSALLRTILARDFPRLTTLSLQSLSINGIHLLDALRRVPQLRNFYIYNIVLVDTEGGFWIDVFEGLRADMRLDNFGLDRLPGRMRVERQWRVCPHPLIPGFNEAVEQYVVGRGPSPLGSVPLMVLTVGGVWAFLRETFEEYWAAMA